MGRQRGRGVKIKKAFKIITAAELLKKEFIDATLEQVIYWIFEPEPLPKYIERDTSMDFYEKEEAWRKKETRRRVKSILKELKKREGIEAVNRIVEKTRR